MNRQDPAKSLIIGNDKQGALETYDLDGTAGAADRGADEVLGQRRRPPGGATSVRARPTWSRRRTPGCASTPSTRRPGSSSRSPPAAPRSTPPAARACASSTVPTGAVGLHGLHLRQRPAVRCSGRRHRPPTRPTGALFKVGSEAEGCVVDDENRALYIDEENVGTWRYDADASGGEQRTMVDASSEGAPDRRHRGHHHGRRRCGQRPADRLLPGAGRGEVLLQRLRPRRPATTVQVPDRRRTNGRRVLAHRRDRRDGRVARPRSSPTASSSARTTTTPPRACRATRTSSSPGWRRSGPSGGSSPRPRRTAHAGRPSRASGSRRRRPRNHPGPPSHGRRPRRRRSQT